MKKEEIRKIYLSKRRKIEDEYYNKLNYSIKTLFLNHFIPSIKSKIHIYLSENSKNREVDTWEIISKLEEYQIVLCAPKIYGKRLKACILEKNTILKENNWGIKEPIKCKLVDPSSLDIVITPLIAFDEQGYRVGYGGGYYDRFLKECKEEIIKIGLCFFEPLKSIDDINSNDVKIDYCVTPNKIYTFSR